MKPVNHIQRKSPGDLASGCRRLVWPAAVTWLVAGLVVSTAAGCKDRHSGDPGGSATCHEDHDHAGHGRDATPGATEHAGSTFARFIPTTPFPEDDWCREHNVPESLCTRCNPELVEQFKAKGDWCGGHKLPESQCLKCNPGFKAKWDAIRPVGNPAGAAEPATRPEASGPVGRPLDAPNEALCDIESQVVRLTAEAARRAGILAEPVRARRMSATLECPARVEFDQTRLAHITPRVKGVIAAVPVGLGQQVAAGSVLAEIDSPALGEARSAYIEARENHHLAQSECERVENINRGIQRMLEVVTADAPIEKARAAVGGVQVGEAKGRLLKAHAELVAARAAMERETRLREQQAGTDKNFESARSGLYAAEAEFQATRETIELGGQRDVQAARKTLKVSETAMNVARRRLLILGVAEEQIDKLTDQSGATLSRYQAHSSTAGLVVQLHAVVGELADELNPLASVADVSNMWLMLDVQERDLVQLRIGLPLLFTIDGLAGQSFEGRLTWISPQVDERTRTVKARADLKNDRGLLKANMFGLARVILRDREETLTVPTGAVQTDGCCQLVFVQRPDDAYQPRKVTLGVRHSGFIEVLDGLQPGEPVAVAGAFLLKTEILKDNIGAGCCEVEPGR